MAALGNEIRYFATGRLLRCCWESTPRYRPGRHEDRPGPFVSGWTVLTLEEIFPPFGLTIRCGPVELRVLRDEDLPGVVDVIAAGVVDPQLPMPFLEAWHEVPYQPGNPNAFPATSLAWWWSQRAAFAPDKWNFALVVRRDGAIVGVQDMAADQFPLSRSISTGSWLGLDHQGKGTGTLMRQAIVGFAFDHLGALECHSGYIDGNAASAAVSRKTGHQPNGRRRIAQAGRDGVEEIRVRVTPDTYIRPEHPIEVQGADAFIRFLEIGLFGHLVGSETRGVR